jgi:hypothetical protein
MFTGGKMQDPSARVAVTEGGSVGERSPGDISHFVLFRKLDVRSISVLVTLFSELSVFKIFHKKKKACFSAANLWKT